MSKTSDTTLNVFEEAPPAGRKRGRPKSKRDDPRLAIPEYKPFQHRTYDARARQYDVTMAEALVNWMAAGRSIDSFAGHMRLPRNVVMAWLGDHPEFMTAFEIGKGARTLFYEDELMRILHGGSGRIDIVMIGLRSAAPEVWAQLKQQIDVKHDHTGTVAHDHRVQAMTPLEMAQRFALAINKAKTIDLTPDKVETHGS